MRRPIGGRVKIGWSTDPKRRIADLGGGFAEAFEFTEPVPIQIESKFHRFMGGDSEWYDLTLNAAMDLIKKWLRSKCISTKSRPLHKSSAGRPAIGRPISLTLTSDQIEWIISQKNGSDSFSPDD